MFKKIFEVVKRRLKLFVMEVGNALTDLILPFLSLAIAIMELLPIPQTWILIAKKAEYYLFKASGTLKEIEKVIREEYENKQ